jgi:hypothetical protein
LTRQEQLRRIAAIRQQMRLAREQLGVALAAMDYEQALALQIEMDHLEGEWCRAVPVQLNEPATV